VFYSCYTFAKLKHLQLLYFRQTQTFTAVILSPNSNIYSCYTFAKLKHLQLLYFRQTQTFTPVILSPNSNIYTCYTFAKLKHLQLLYFRQTQTFISSIRMFSTYWVEKDLACAERTFRKVVIRFPCFSYDCLEFWGAEVPQHPTATRLRGGWPWNRGSIPGRSNIYPLFWNIQTASGASQAIRLLDTVDYFPGSKADWTRIWPMTPSNVGG
jgi:hypothetical protein